jgi:hypothetical protein
MNEALQTALRKLRLSGMIQTLDVRLQEAVGNRLSHAEFLELVLQDELAVRSDNPQTAMTYGCTARRWPSIPASPS